MVSSSPTPRYRFTIGRLSAHHGPAVAPAARADRTQAKPGAARPYGVGSIGMAPTSRTLRETLDRLVLPYVRLITKSVNDEATSMRESISDESRGVKDALQASLSDEAKGVQTTLQASLSDEARGVRDVLQASLSDEARGVRDAVQASLTDEAVALRESVSDEARGVRDSLQESLGDEARAIRDTVVGSVVDESRALRETVVGSVVDESRGVKETIVGSVVDEARALKETVVGSVIDESRAVRETVVGSVVDESRAIKEEARAARTATEAEMASLRANIGSLSVEVEGLRSDLVELNRVLRMQGDAADQVAEVLGRALTRLSAEVEILTGALEGSGAVREGSSSGPA